MYSIIFSDLAFKQLKKLDRAMSARILAVLKRCRIRPYAFVKKLVGCPYFRLRVGDYRVILDIKQKELMIFVIQIAHRKQIHKKPLK